MGHGTYKCGNVESVIRIQPCKDPLTKMLFGRFGYKVVYFWVACNAVFILTSLHYKTLTHIELPFKSVDTVAVPLLRDKNFYIFFALGICGIILTDQGLRAVPRTFADLWENEVLQSKTKMERHVGAYNKQLEEVEKKINSKKSYIFAVLYSVISVILLYLDLHRVPIEKSPIILYSDIRVFPLTGIAVNATYAVLYFLLIIMVYKGVLLIYFLRKLHTTFDFQVNPLHLDGCGGLKPVGDFCIAISYIVFVFFIVVVAFFTFPHVEELNLALYSSLFLYVFFASFFFVYPIWPIHNSMKAQKSEILRELKEALGPDYWESLDRLIERSMESSTPRSKRLETIYEMADIMRIWPFNVSGLLLFLTAALIPVLSVMAIAFGAGDSIRLVTTLFIPVLNISVKVVLMR